MLFTTLPQVWTFNLTWRKTAIHREGRLSSRVCDEKLADQTITKSVPMIAPSWSNPPCPQTRLSAPPSVFYWGGEHLKSKHILHHGWDKRSSVLYVCWCLTGAGWLVASCWVHLMVHSVNFQKDKQRLLTAELFSLDCVILLAHWITLYSHRRTTRVCNQATSLLVLQRFRLW